MKKIYCPYCQMRLFDAKDNGKGAEIEIKCTRCRKIVSIDLNEAVIDQELRKFVSQITNVAV